MGGVRRWFNRFPRGKTPPPRASFRTDGATSAPPPTVGHGSAATADEPRENGPGLERALRKEPS